MVSDRPSVHIALLHSEHWWLNKKIRKKRCSKENGSRICIKIKTYYSPVRSPVTPALIPTLLVCANGPTYSTSSLSTCKQRAAGGHRSIRSGESGDLTDGCCIFSSIFSWQCRSSTPLEQLFKSLVFNLLSINKIGLVAHRRHVLMQYRSWLWPCPWGLNIIITHRTDFSAAVMNLPKMFVTLGNTVAFYSDATIVI